MEKLHAGHREGLEDLAKERLQSGVGVWGGEKGRLEVCFCGLSHGV